MTDIYNNQQKLNFQGWLLIYLNGKSFDRFLISQINTIMWMNVLIKTMLRGLLCSVGNYKRGWVEVVRGVTTFFTCLASCVVSLVLKYIRLLLGFHKRIIHMQRYVCIDIASPIAVVAPPCYFHIVFHYEGCEVIHWLPVYLIKYSSLIETALHEE